MATSASPAPLRSSSATELEMTSNHLGIGGLRDGNAVILHINGRNSFSSVESSQEEYQSGWCAVCLCSMYIVLVCVILLNTTLCACTNETCSISLQ